MLRLNLISLHIDRHLEGGCFMIIGDPSWIPSTNLCILLSSIRYLISPSDYHLFFKNTTTHLVPSSCWSVFSNEPQPVPWTVREHAPEAEGGLGNHVVKVDAYGVKGIYNWETSTLIAYRSLGPYTLLIPSS